MTRKTRTRQPQKPKTNGAETDRSVVTVTIRHQAIRVPAGNHLNLQPPADPNQPFLLIRQGDGSWSGILLEPGQEWELRTKGSAAKTPAIWLPGMPRGG